MRVDIRRIAAIKTPDGQVLGNRTKVKIVKNKVAPPFREAEFDIMYNEGISKEGSLLDLGVELNVIEKKGAWLYFEGVQVAQGRDAAKTELKANKELYKKIEAATLKRLNGSSELPDVLGGAA